MALIISSTTAAPVLHLPTSSKLNYASTSNSACSLYRKPCGFRAQILNERQTCLPLLLNEKRTRQLLCKASEAETDVAGPVESSPLPPSETTEEKVAAVNHKPSPEEKLQLKLEQKMRMKLAKKARLKRKRLVRKRHLRKKGRWPPSKMKKLKNV